MLTSTLSKQTGHIMTQQDNSPLADMADVHNATVSGPSWRKLAVQGQSTWIATQHSVCLIHTTDAGIEKHESEVQKILLTPEIYQVLRDLSESISLSAASDKPILHAKRIIAVWQRAQEVLKRAGVQ